MITVEYVEFRGWAAVCDDHGIITTRSDRRRAEVDALEHGYDHEGDVVLVDVREVEGILRTERGDT